MLRWNFLCSKAHEKDPLASGYGLPLNLSVGWKVLLLLVNTYFIVLAPEPTPAPTARSYEDKGYQIVIATRLPCGGRA